MLRWAAHPLRPPQLLQRERAGGGGGKAGGRLRDHHLRRLGHFLRPAPPRRRQRSLPADGYRRRHDRSLGIGLRFRQISLLNKGPLRRDTSIGTRSTYRVIQSADRGGARQPGLRRFRDQRSVRCKGPQFPASTWCGNSRRRPPRHCRAVPLNGWRRRQKRRLDRSPDRPRPAPCGRRTDQ